MSLNRAYLCKGGGRLINGTDFIFPHRPFVTKNTPFIIAIIANNRPFVGFKYNYGFTLVELITTVVVAAILLTVAAPSFNSFIRNQRLITQNNDFIADLNFTRSESVKRTTSVTVCKSLNPMAVPPVCDTTDANPWSTGRVIFIDPNGNGVIDAGEQMLRIRQAIDGINSSSNRLLGDGVAAGGTANIITYTSNGMTTLTVQSEIRSCDSRGGQFGRAIVINSAGRVKLSKVGQDKDNNPLAC